MKIIKDTLYNGMRLTKSQVSRSEFKDGVARITKILDQLRRINDMWASFIYTKSEIRNSQNPAVTTINCACDLLEDVDYDIWDADDVVDLAYELEDTINHICKNNIAPSTWRQFVED